MKKNIRDSLRNNILFSDSGNNNSDSSESLDLDQLTPDQAMRLARRAKAEAVSPKGIKDSGISFGRTSQEGSILDAAGKEIISDPRSVIDNPQRYRKFKFDPRSKAGDFEKLSALKVEEGTQKPTKKPYGPSGPNESGGGETSSDNAETNDPGASQPGGFLGQSTQNALSTLGKVYGVKLGVSMLAGIPLSINPSILAGVLGVSAFNDFMDSRDEVPEVFGPADPSTYNKDWGPRSFKDRLKQAYHTLRTRFSEPTMSLKDKLDAAAAGKRSKNKNTTVSSLSEVLGVPQYSPTDPETGGPMGMTGYGGFQGLGIGNPGSYGGSNEDSGGPGPGEGEGSGAEGSSGGGSGGSDAGSEDSGGGGW